jgi:hypothetical protein
MHPSVVELLVQLAERELIGGRTEESVASVRAAVRYCGVLHADVPLLGEQFEKHELHRELHGRLLAWAEHPANSPETIGAALRAVEVEELRWWITDPLALVREYESTNEELDRRLVEAGWRGAMAWPAVCRERRKAACAASNLYRFLRATPPSQRSFAAFPPPLSSPDDDDPAWALRDRRHVQFAMGGIIPPGVPWGLSERAVNLLWDRETRIRCTCAAMAAIAYRRARGNLPRTLADVVPQFASFRLLTDPWTGEPLRIEPDGLSEKLTKEGDVELLPSKTPFVWSAGPDGISITPQRDGAYHLTAAKHFCGRPVQALRYVFPLRPTDLITRTIGQ